MALRRKKVAPPLFYDIESNTLYPKKGRFDDVCRVCATPATAFTDLIGIYGQDGKNLKLSAKINKFLPISVDESDGLPRSICVNCKDVLLKMDQLYLICQKTDAYFNGQMHNSVEPEEAEAIEVFDDGGEETNIVTTYNCDVNSPNSSEPDIIGFTVITEDDPLEGTSKQFLYNSELPTDVSSIKEECVSEFSDEEDNVHSDVDFTEYFEPATSSHNTGKTVTVTKSGRQVKQQKKYEDYSDDSSETEDEGNEDSDDPDFIPELEHQSVTYNPVTALIPKQLPFRCDYCVEILKYQYSIKSHYESHRMHLCTNCYVHYETRDELNQHYKDEHPSYKEKTTKYKQHFRCNFCPDYYHSRKRMKEHLQQEHQKLVCYKCLATFDVLSELEAHLDAEKHGHMCRICKIDFYTPDLWKSHVQQHYDYDTVKVVMPTEKENLETSIDHTVNALGVPVEINEFTCDVQSKEISLDVLSTSKEESHKTFPFVCEFYAESLTNPTMAYEHYKKHEVHLCTYCFNNFPSVGELTEHQENVHTFSCALCSFKITGASANSLKTHLGTNHGDIYAKRRGVYECGICDMRSNRKAKLKTHMKEVHEKSMCYVCLKCFNDENSHQAHLELESHDFQCKVCGTDYDQKRKLNHHLAFSHPNYVAENKEKAEETTYTCIICNSTHDKLHFLKRHYLTLHKKFVCLLCSLVFDTHSDIDTHSLEVHGCHTSWSYKCNECGRYFEAEYNLTLHIKTVHKKMRHKHLCEQCGRSFTSQSQLQEHVLRIHEKVITKGNESVQCDICGKVILAKCMRKHLKRHAATKVYTCVDCGKNLYTNSQLEAHMKKNHKVKEITEKATEECPHCRIKLQKSRLKKHMEEEHSVEWTYMCIYCNVNYSSDTEIWQHCTTEHGMTQESNDIQPYVRTSPHQCDTCHIYLANASKLNMHKYVAHSSSNTEVALSKNPYKKEYVEVCELCGETVNKHYKYYHMYKVHNVPLKYPCDFCERSYNAEALKMKHIARYHTEDRTVICDICERAFKTKKRMRIHKKKVHFENKELPCPICGKTFKTYTSFKRHVKMHSADMPFRCETCDRGFHTKTTYKNHMSRHENNLRIYQPWKKKVEIVIPTGIEPNVSIQG